LYIRNGEMLYPTVIFVWSTCVSQIDTFHCIVCCCIWWPLSWIWYGIWIKWR
jgi:hypothetical protein